MIRVHVERGDVLDAPCDVLVSTANVHLNMSGGVNGAILQRGGEGVQAELRSYLSERGLTFVEPGTVVPTGPGPLSFRAILHAVAINGFYESSGELVARTISAALSEAESLGAGSVALPALATGYGPLSAREFASGLAAALGSAPDSSLRELRVVLWREGEAAQVREVLAATISPSFELAQGLSP